MAIDKQSLEQGWALYKKNKRKAAIKYALLALFSIVMFIVIWQVIVQYRLVNVRNLPSPVRVFETLVFKINNTPPDGNTLITNIGASLEVALSGFLLATVIGIPLGWLMGWFLPFDKFMRPVFELMRPVPPIAWIPIIVVLFGIGLQAKAIIIFLAVFVPCVINAYLGVQLTSRALINVSKTFGAGSFETFVKVGIPSSLPMVFTGLRTALGGAWSTLVAAEMLAASAGLGNMLQIGRLIGRADIVVVGMVTISALGALLGLLLNYAERHVLKWKVKD